VQDVVIKLHSRSPLTVHAADRLDSHYSPSKAIFGGRLSRDLLRHGNDQLDERSRKRPGIRDKVSALRGNVYRFPGKVWFPRQVGWSKKNGISMAEAGGKTTLRFPRSSFPASWLQEQDVSRIDSNRHSLPNAAA
jgi:hypothetical protein